ADMAKKLVAVAGDRRQLLQELIWLREHTDDAHAAVCSRVYYRFLLKKEHPPIILTPILLRTANTERDGDHGRFADENREFGYPIRSLRVIVDTDDLFDLAVKVYREARKLAEL